MHSGIEFQEQDLRNKLFRTSFLEQALHKLSPVYTLLIASSQKDCNNNGEWRCSDNDDGCGGAVAVVALFNE